MYDDWQPMTTGNRGGNGNGNGNSNGNRMDERKSYGRQRNQGGYQNNNSGHRGYPSYMPQHQHQPQQMQNPNQMPNPNAMNQGPNVDMILREEAYNVVGCAINILNELGPGLAIDCYEKALKVEFSLKDIPLLENQHFDIIYKEVNVGDFTLKLIAYETIIVLPIVADTINDGDIAKMINQLKVAHYQAGLIFNFKYPKLQWQRVIL